MQWLHQWCTLSAAHSLSVTESGNDDLWYTISNKNTRRGTSGLDIISTRYSGEPFFLPIVAMLIGFFFIFASVDAPGSDSVQKSLALLSQGNQQGCQEALDICAANAQAEQLRSTLVANGRPLRQMHLDYMRKVHHDSERRLVCAQLYRLA